MPSVDCEVFILQEQAGCSAGCSAAVGARVHVVQVVWAVPTSHAQQRAQLCSNDPLLVDQKFELCTVFMHQEMFDFLKNI